MRTEYQEQAKVFKALCDPKRLSILEQLRSGEKCACVLQEPLDLTQSGLSYHMKILCDSGNCRQPSGGEMDTLPPEHFRQGVRGGAVEKVDNPGHRGKTHLSKVHKKRHLQGKGWRFLSHIISNIFDILL